jgi:hypothetical protein
MRMARRIALMVFSLLVYLHAQNPGTHGAGTVAISGSDHSVLITPGHQVCYPRIGCHWVPPVYSYDAGTVTITVNGHPDTINYDQGDNSLTVAQKLSNAINGDSAAFVTASSSGASTSATVSLTERNVGTNDPLSAGAISNTSYGPSFTVTPSGSTLTGGTPAGPDSINVLTQHNDNFRTGQNIQETILTPGNVNTSQFSKLFTSAVDGQIYAQPLYVSNLNIAGGVHNVVFVATEEDSVYAFDADTGSRLWHASMIDVAHGVSAGGETTIISDVDEDCSDINPHYGITATPVIDLSTNTMYVEAKSKAIGAFASLGTYFHRLHALDITSGSEKSGSPVIIASPGGFSPAFGSFRQQARPGLLLMGGKIYIGFASHCDHETYYGWVFAYDSASLQRQGVFITTPNTLSVPAGGIPNAGGIWMSGAGLAGDGSSVYAATGNGNFDLNVPPTDVADSVIKLNFNSGGLGLADSFTPWDQNIRLACDADLGAGGVLLLPDQPGTHPHELVQAGKIGRPILNNDPGCQAQWSQTGATQTGAIYVLDRDNLGRYCTTCNAGTGNTQIVQDLRDALQGAGQRAGEGAGLWSMPAYWNNMVYFWGVDDVLRSFSLSNGLLSFQGASSDIYGFPGATPAISANGTNNGIVWSLKTDLAESGGPVSLRAHDALTLNLLYSSDQTGGRDTPPGTAIKFAVPTVANGKVYVGTAGSLSVFGLTAGNPPPAPTTCNGIGGALWSGNNIYPGSCLVSPDGNHAVKLQADGNLVVYNLALNTAIWSSGTAGQAVSFGAMQHDGNFVLYGPSGNAVWNTGTAQSNIGTGWYFLSMQDDGNLVVYYPPWASGTTSSSGVFSVPPSCPNLGSQVWADATIYPGYCMVSPDGVYTAFLQTDGNFVIYRMGLPIWSTNTGGANVNYLSFQSSNGDFFLYDANGGVVVWDAGINQPAGLYMLQIQDDGNFVLYHPLWSSGTQGR